MTDDEEQQLRQDLLEADVELRRKQAFWETPRNVAILVGATAAIAAAIGFWLGQQSAPLPPIVRPVTFGGFDMTPAVFIDAVESAGIVVIAAMLVYVVVRLDRTLTGAARDIKSALTTQFNIVKRLERIERRLDNRGPHEDPSNDH